MDPTESVAECVERNFHRAIRYLDFAGALGDDASKHAPNRKLRAQAWPERVESSNPLARLCVAAIVGLACVGCAELTFYTKAMDLGSNSYATDVKQRIVISKKWPGDGKSKAERHVVCAEPSPDALTVLSASGGVSANTAKIDGSVNAGVAFSENGAFVGLRTHSIQLLRDSMYRICEAYANGGIDERTYISLQRRFQSTMMGLLAIEQLTGPVVASQAMLTTNATSQAGGSPGDAAVNAAKERVDAANTKLIEEQKNEAKASLAVEDLENEIKALEKEKNGLSAIDANQARRNELTEAITTKRGKLRDAQIEKDDAANKRKLAQERVRDETKDLRAAQAKVSLAASGSGSLGAVADALRQSNASLTLGVTAIVTEINFSYLRDSCLSFVSELLQEPGLITKLNEAEAAASRLAPADRVWDEVELAFEERKLDAKTQSEVKAVIAKAKAGSRESISPTIMVKSYITTCQNVLAKDADRMSTLYTKTFTRIGPGSCHSDNGEQCSAANEQPTGQGSDQPAAGKASVPKSPQDKNK